MLACSFFKAIWEYGTPQPVPLLHPLDPKEIDVANPYANHVGTRVTDQKTKPLDRPEMVANSEGGFVFGVDDWKRLERFLILGNEGGTYYATEKQLTVENAQVVMRCLHADPAKTCRVIHEISDSGRAPKQAPTLFAYALAVDNAPDEALPYLNWVLRTGTHLFQFLETLKSFRKINGRRLRRALGGWYSEKTPEDLAYQVVKYRSREKWSHRDLLRMIHMPLSRSTARHHAIYDWICHPEKCSDDMLGRIEEFPRIAAYEQLQDPELSLSGVVRLIRDHRMPRECVPNQWFQHAEVWEALLENMPMEAMLRNLGKMSEVGLLAPMSEAARIVCDRLGDQQLLTRARMHPLKLLVAQRIYRQGRGMLGGLSWTVNQDVLGTLDDAFKLAFGTFEPSNARTLIGLDVSGSMSCGTVCGAPLDPMSAAAAMSLVALHTEPQVHVMAFDHGIREIPVTKRHGIDGMLGLLPRNYGGTDCALPMKYALQKKIPVDAFYVYTDNETHSGPMHVYQALRQYREKMGIPAKLCVVGMISNGFSIADPDDFGMLDVVGFDTAAPALMAEFARVG